LHFLIRPNTKLVQLSRVSDFVCDYFSALFFVRCVVRVLTSLQLAIS